MQTNQVDVAVIGAGIVGLAHALTAAKQGLKVVVFERNSYAIGASVRNFGMIWPIGQPTGLLRERALKSREIWQETAQEAGFYLDTCGSLHLAYREDEMAVLEEFVATTGGDNIALLTPEEVAEKSQVVVTQGLLGALWSSTEMTVDPREAIAKIPILLKDKYQVQFCFNRVVTSISYPDIQAGEEIWKAERIFICSGSDFETLYPSLHQQSGMTKVKLQMMRTSPQNWRLGPSLCGGLTLTHYSAFAHCQSLAALKARIESETPHFCQWHIHVLMSQNELGELILGDSHEYGMTLDPFDRHFINQYVLDYLKGFANIPNLEIAETWHGIYAKIPGKTEFIANPEPGVTIVNGLGGAGMTLSFGLANDRV
ncbi:TIGR03364 family FAD-dependent oxidoreductase [Gloeocapsa sp. PCC 73106]|uniref:TIGR03364 family FAD-dependent oxidoreductase n=1 Tax=Gloeocapsa sp. PCC 73106 TaxID=102232 RepID=UPI0002ABBA81|nr:TIGR03364 family FAD-dependent oxidoreductase [Gloeocapsa sp. PCC 73106]ELR97839.1 FAD dependent oxidoreductase TIGR03364 [Gloeocapsa sp. PCC 73106]